MSYKRTFEGAALVAVLATVLFTAAPAAAETMVCAVGKPETSPPCSAGEKEYKARTLLYSLARGKAVFSSGVGNVECNESAAEGALFGTGTKEGSLSKLTWSNSKSPECPSTISGVKTAKLEVVGTPTMLFEWSNNSTLETGPNAIVTLHKVLLRMIMGGIVCLYKADMENSESYTFADEKVLVLFFNHDNTPSGLAEVHYEKVTLVDNPTDSLTCPRLLTYNAEYLVKGEGEESALAARG
jgi:hypothetical protein